MTPISHGRRLRQWASFAAVLAGALVCIGTTSPGECYTPLEVAQTDSFTPDQLSQRYRVRATDVNSIHVRVSSGTEVRWIDPPAVFFPDAGEKPASFAPRSIDVDCRWLYCGSSLCTTTCDQFEIEVTRPSAAGSADYTWSVVVEVPCDSELEELKVEPE
jgi:hypothetical protein